MKKIFHIALIISSLISLYSVKVSAQCNTGNETTCKCDTAPILCSITELDGYQSYMAPYQHPQDGPNGFCGSMTQSDNPNWFGFIAWCDAFTMDVQLSNCQENNNWIGVQLAIFPACNTNNSIACNSDCNGDGLVSIDLFGLNVGQTYYFMMDGCFGATCDFVIDITGENCNEFIEDWSEDIQGESIFCKNEIASFEVEDLRAANFYHWYLNGEEIDITTTNQNFIELAQEGTYDLCVDVSNDCIDVSANPLQICKTITVIGSNSGVLNYQESHCPGESGLIALSDYKTGNDFSQFLIITNEAGIVIEISQSNSIVASTDVCEDLLVYSLNYYNVNPIPLPSIGDEYVGSPCIGTCCDEQVRIISFKDLEDPIFSELPFDQSFSSLLELDPIEALISTDNCDEEISVTGTEDIMADLCDGGTIIRQWERIDFCGNAVRHQQTIDIQAAPAPISILSEDVVLDCESPSILLSTDLSSLTENTLVQWLDQDGILLSNESFILVEEAGTYNLLLTDTIFMCYDSSDEITIDFQLTSSTIMLLPSVTLVQEFEAYTFKPEIYFDEASIVNIEWETAAKLSCYDCLNPLMTEYEEWDEVSLIIKTENGCEYRSTTVIDIDYPPKIFIPNIFNSESTENFTIYTNGEITEIKEAHIYDRWGNIIFSNFNFLPNDADEGWNGRMDNALASQGVYIYLFVYEAKGEEFTIVGDVTLVR